MRDRAREREIGKRERERDEERMSRPSVFGFACDDTHSRAQADGIAARKDATPPHCVAKLRLIFPDEDSETSPDHVVATAQARCL